MEFIVDRKNHYGTQSIAPRLPDPSNDRQVVPVQEDVNVILPSGRAANDKQAARMFLLRNDMVFTTGGTL